MTDADDALDARDQHGTDDTGTPPDDPDEGSTARDDPLESAGTQGLRDHVTIARVLNVVGVVVLLAVVVPFAVYAFPPLVGASESYVVLSGSMEPAMSPGDAIVIEDVAATEIETGDVITYSRAEESSPTTHRVIDVRRVDGEVAFRTKGDANEEPDQELVRPAAVEGRVMTIAGHLFVIPYIGYVLEFASSQTGFLVMFVLPIGLFLLNEAHAFVTAGSSSDDDGEATPSSVADTPDGAGDEAMSGEASGSVEPGGPSEAGDGVGVRPAELRIGVIALAGFAAYSSWVAYTLVEPWAVGTAAAVVMAALLFGGLYVFGEPAGEDGTGDGTSMSGSSDGDDAAVDRTGSRDGRESTAVDAGVASGADDAGVVVEIGEPDAAAFDRPRVAVPVYDAMVELAAVTGGVVYRDPDDPVHYVPSDEVTYVHRGHPADGDADEDSNGNVTDRVEHALASPAVDGALRGVDDGAGGRAEGGTSDERADPASGRPDQSDPRDAVESESPPTTESSIPIGFERRNAPDSDNSNEGTPSDDPGERDRDGGDPELASLDPAMEELERRVGGESDD